MKKGDIVICKTTIDIRDFPCDPPYPQGLWKPPHPIFQDAEYSFYKNKSYEVLEKVTTFRGDTVYQIGIRDEFVGYFISKTDIINTNFIKKLPIFEDYFYYTSKELRKIKLNELSYKSDRKDKLIKIWY